MHSLIFLGDLLGTDDVCEYIKKDDVEGLIGSEFKDILFDPDNGIIINLEGPITNTDSKIKKGGSPNIKSDPLLADFLSRFPKLVVTGANNHITDYGEAGLIDTETVLDRKNITRIGFGHDQNEIKTHSFTVVEANAKKVCLYALAQNEFSSSLYNGWGSVSYDPLTTFDEIAALKKECDYLVVLFHGGKENYRYPSPNQVLICRKMIDVGADLVICQHSHCIGCEEDYKNKKIVYGTGNFIFNLACNELWNTSIAPFVSIGDDGSLKVDYIPFVKENNCVRLASGKDADKIMSDFTLRSESIKDFEFVKKAWIDCCNENKYYILRSGFTRPQSRILFVLDKLTNHRLLNWLFRNKTQNLTLHNYIRCEVLNEMVQTILTQME